MAHIGIYRGLYRWYVGYCKKNACKPMPFAQPFLSTKNYHKTIIVVSHVSPGLLSAPVILRRAEHEFPDRVAEGTRR